MVGVYRPPSGNLDYALENNANILDKLLTKNTPIVLMGDINVDNLEASNENTKLEEVLESYQITRMKLPPTRVTQQQHPHQSIGFVQIRKTTKSQPQYC